VRIALSLVVVGVVVAGVMAQPAAAKERKHTAREGVVRAEFRYQLPAGSRYYEKGRFRIWVRGRVVVDRRISLGAEFPRPISIRQLDGTGLPEVLFSLYTGGMGCCFTNWIYTGEKRTRAPWLNPPGIRDADGDGKPEIHTQEHSWSLWGARAGGRLPVKVWTYAAGKVTDVTRAFPAEVQADQADHYAFYEQMLAGGEPISARNGIAAYVADGYSLGQGEKAMEVLQAAVDAGTLDDPSQSGAEFVEELRALLRRRGYTP
jgi:hypothetical protein